MNCPLEECEKRDVKGSVVVITGASSGIGLATAKDLVARGARVVLGARDVSGLAEFVSASAGSAVAGVCDIRKPADCAALMDLAVSTFGRIDILINSAGINIRGAIDELSLEDFKQVMDVNVTGTWLSSRAVIPYMKKGKRGSIINLASALGLIGLSNRTPYTSSKGAVVQMTRALSLEMAPFNINVNAICPGPFLTEMNLPIADTEEGLKFVVGATALGRWAELKEIQGAAIYLASDAGSYMVGAMLSVDGGWTAR